jgi:hypothetical protein
LRRPDGNGDWLWNLDGIDRVPYRLPEVLSADPDEVIFITEGPKDADRLVARGLVATTNCVGAGKWRPEYNQHFRGRNVAILPDNDDAGHHHAEQVAASLHGVAAEVRVLALPGLGDKEDVSDWLDMGHAHDELLRLAAEAPLWESPQKPSRPPSDISDKVAVPESDADSAETAPATLAEVEATFQSCLFMPDCGALRFVLAVVAGHKLGSDPLWGLVVAPPSGTKTEIIRSLEGVPKVFPLSELTARTFASGLETGKRDPSLLTRVSDHVLTLKDFTTVLTMHREERQGILAQLREIYDGRYDKAWGTGKELHWHGRLGFIAGVTPIIDVHHSVHQVLGERFLLYRSDQPDRRHMALRAMQGRGQEAEMRAALKDVVARFVKCLSPENAPTLPPAIEECLSYLADFVSTARSGVVRDGYSHELTLAPDPEAPARLAKQLANLTVGYMMLDNSDAVGAYNFTSRVASDCIPGLRARLLDALGPARDYVTTSAVAASVGYPTVTVRRALEDLTALHVVSVSKADSQGKADRWALSDWSRERLRGALSPEASPDSRMGSVSEKSEGVYVA